MSEAALLPGEIQLKGTMVNIKSPKNPSNLEVYRKEAVDQVIGEYYKTKWRNPAQLFAPDGSSIQREGYDEYLNEGLRTYFEEHVLGTEGYQNPFDKLELPGYIEEGEYGLEEQEDVYIGILYDKWQRERYGKTRGEKFTDWMVSREGVHTTLDVVGFF